MRGGVRASFAEAIQSPGTLAGLSCFDRLAPFLVQAFEGQLRKAFVMPYLHVQTNANPTEPERSAFLEAATDVVAEELGKNKSYVMACIETGLSLNFAGSEIPAAFMELKVLGLDGAKNQALATLLSNLARVHLHVDEDRCFSRFVDTPRGFWGLGNNVF